MLFVESVMLLKLVQESKAFTPIYVTLCGTVMLVRLAHLKKNLFANRYYAICNINMNYITRQSKSKITN